MTSSEDDSKAEKMIFWRASCFSRLTRRPISPRHKSAMCCAVITFRTEYIMLFFFFDADERYLRGLVALLYVLDEARDGCVALAGIGRGSDHGDALERGMRRKKKKIQ